MKWVNHLVIARSTTALLDPAFVTTFWDFPRILATFAYGVLIHILADLFTVSGVSLTPNAGHRFHLFGGGLRTGGNGEYGIAWGLAGLCFVLTMLFKPHGGSSWHPFFYNWNGVYQSGVVDAKEWKDNRFKFF